MKRSLLSVLAGVALAPLAAAAGTVTFTNEIALSNPHIVATTLLNLQSGSISAGGTYPFETYDTLNVTNWGTMTGSPGFWFNTLSSATHLRSMAANFVNLGAGVVSASEGGTASGSGCEVAPVGPGYLMIWATNIIIQGYSPASLIVGANCGMELTAININLYRSGLEVVPIWMQPLGSANGQGTFTPDLGIYDLSADQASLSAQNSLDDTGLWDGTTAATGPGGTFTILPLVADSYITRNSRAMTSVTLTNYTDQGGTNVVPYTVTVSLCTNVIKGAVFASAPPGFLTTSAFGSEAGARTVEVLTVVGMPNNVTGDLEPAYLYFEDTLASSTNRGLLANSIGCPAATSRPANYIVDRSSATAGTANNRPPEPDFFTTSGESLLNTNIMTDLVTNTAALTANGAYAAYEPLLDNVVSRLALPGTDTETNMPGRIRIHAQNLDMTRTRIRTESDLFIETPHLISTTNTSIDGPSLRFDLGSQDGNLKFQNLAKQQIDRLTGSAAIWSAVWTNMARVIFTNNFVFTNATYTNFSSPISVDTNTTPPTTNYVTGTNTVVLQLAPITNFINMVYHATMVDAETLVTNLPVNVYNLTTRGTTNTVIYDDMSVVTKFSIAGQSLTLRGNLTFPGSMPTNPLASISDQYVTEAGTPITNWSSVLAPDLLYFTNYGTLSIPEVAHFGDDRTVPYSTFINAGTNTAYNIHVKSGYFENTGLLQASGLMVLEGGSGKLQNGRSTSGAETRFLAGSLKLNNYRVTSGGPMFITVTNSLLDAGTGSSNVLDTPYGFNLLRKPQTGDLIGTTFSSTAARFAPVYHTWAAEDRGVSAAGFSNNVAIGTLALREENGAMPSQHFFQGTGARNGIYVDVLDLSALGSWDAITGDEKLGFDAGTVIYFAAAKVGFTPPNNADGVPQEPEEFLDGKFGGHLRWVNSFAGPGSSIAVLINGKTTMVNKALRLSKIIDSNGNGLANYWDNNPFNGVGLQSISTTNHPPLSVAVSWLGTPGATYRVDYSPSLTSPTWTPLAWYTNTATVVGSIQVWDTNGFAGGSQRYYRVVYLP